MFSCLIVEDDYSFGLSVKIQLQEFGFKVIDIVSTIKDISSTLFEHHVDLILSDIKLKNGEYSYEYFSTHQVDIPIIYFSALADGSLYEKTKESNPYIILSKPLNDNSLKSAVFGALKNKIEAKQKGGEIERSDKNIFIRVKGKLISINPQNVRYVHSEGNHCFIYLDNKKIAIRSSLKNILEKLSNPDIIKVHRAYLTNVKFIDDVKISENEITLSDTTIPIGRKYKSELMTKLNLSY